MRGVFACDIDAEARAVYQQNFGLMPVGDIAAIRAEDVPDHDVLCAGFPCQPFSIIGKREGFREKRGFLFLDIARIVAAKRPAVVVLENVKQLAAASDGKVLAYIVDTLSLLGYATHWRVLNARDYGVPQQRERVLVVASRLPWADWSWLAPVTMPPLASVLDPRPDRRHWVSARIRQSRHRQHRAAVTPSIWHENKGGAIASHPYSCALRAGASYNYLLVNGERRLTPRELFRLQGFPDSFLLPADAQARRQAGNAVPVPMIRAVLARVVHALRHAQVAR